MAKRRGNKEGTVFQDQNGDWWAQLPPDERGRRPKRKAKTYREALLKLRELQKERDQGLKLGVKQPTVEAFTAIWLEQVVKRTLKESTYAGYGYVLKQYVLPHIGAIRLDKLTAPHVQQLVNDLVDAGHSPWTVRNAYLRLRAMLDVAVQYRYVAHNVADKIALPRVTTEQRALTANEASALLEAVEGLRNAAIYHCLLGLGLRRGEALGLAWRDLNWEAQTIKISQQVQQYVGSKVVISAPKTETSKRTLPLTDDLTARLWAHWQNQLEERAFLGANWKEHGLIFASEKGTPIAPRNLDRNFKAALERANLADVRLHDLRHTFATLLGEQGVSDRVIGALLGHVPATITAHYAQATLAAMREVVERLAAILLKRAA